MEPRPAPTTTTVCIAGCGPAGAVLGLLLARAGIEVVVLEKHADFLRDFRGDTIHASTLQVLAELDLLPAFEQLPQQRTTSVRLVTDEGTFALGDFTRLPGRFQWVALVPQWDFLEFLTREAGRSPAFTLVRQAEVVGLVHQAGVVRGVRYRTAQGEEHELQALLTVAADGRHSAVRAAAGLRRVEHGAHMDVLWYRIPKGPGDPDGTFARLSPGRFLPMIDRGTYWQGAYTMPKGAYEGLRSAGIEALRAEVRAALPMLGQRVDEALRSWQDTGFLEVRVDRLRRWHLPGLLCIGDAAHAMSPVAGVGINLAVQDAVAAANLLVGPLRRGVVTERDLARVQRRRSLPTQLTQHVQLAMQRRLFSDPRGSGRGSTLPRSLRLLLRTPALTGALSRFMAIGVRSEHVRTPVAVSSVPPLPTQPPGGTGPRPAAVPGTPTSTRTG